MNNLSLYFIIVCSVNSIFTAVVEALEPVSVSQSK